MRYEAGSETANLLLMTPYYWAVDQATQARLAELTSLNTEVDVILHAYQRTHETSQEQPTE